MTFRQSVATLGTQRGRSRYYAEGKYLLRAGFTPATYVSIEVHEDGLTITPSATPTAHRVSSKQQGAVPVLDLTAQELRDALGGPGTELNVRVGVGSITLTRSVLAARIAARPTDRSVGSLFSGGGLLDQAAANAGFTPRFGIEIEERYAATFEANHPTATMYRMSVHEAALQPLPPVELLCVGLPCFEAGTLVLTSEGYLPIEQVRQGQLVLTHRGRWRGVLATSVRTNAPLQELKASGVLPTRTTAEHPYYVKLKAKAYSKGKQIRAFSDPKWTNASELTPQHFTAQVLPPECVDPYGPDFWFLVGRYLSDGWRVARSTQGRPPSTAGSVVIAANVDKSAELEAAITQAGFHWTKVVDRTCNKYHITSTWLYQFLEPFGCYAHGKGVPGTWLGLPDYSADALLRGMLAGDGHYEPRWQQYRYVTTSPMLALACSMLYQRAYGVAATIRVWKRAHTPGCIEGRSFNQRDQYIVTLPPRNKEAFVDDAGTAWRPVRESRASAERSTVYNFAVDEDNSYVANGAVVHNCEPWSQARRTDRGSGAKRDMTLPATAHELGDLALWAFTCILRCNPRTLVLEEAPAFAKSETCYALAGALQRVGYHVHWEVINAADHGGLSARKRTVLVARTDALDVAWPAATTRTAPVSALLDHDVPDDAWFDAASKPWVFEHAAKQAAKGNGFGFTVVAPTDTSMPIIKKRYHAGQGDNPMLAHPTRPNTYRWFTVRETARIMGLPDAYRLPEAKTIAGEVIGQGVDVTAFTRLLSHVTS